MIVQTMMPFTIYYRQKYEHYYAKTEVLEFSFEIQGENSGAVYVLQIFSKP